MVPATLDTCMVRIDEIYRQNEDTLHTQVKLKRKLIGLNSSKRYEMNKKNGKKKEE